MYVYITSHVIRTQNQGAVPTILNYKSYSKPLSICRFPMIYGPTLVYITLVFRHVRPLPLACKMFPIIFI